MTDADLCEVVIQHLIDTTPNPPSLTEAEAADSKARSAHIEAVTEWSTLLGKRQRAARDLMEALGFRVSWSLKTLGDLLDCLPASESGGGGSQKVTHD